MKCLVSGAGGFIGSALSRQLAARGCPLVLLVRTHTRELKADRVHCVELGRESIAAEVLEGVENVYHCAGIAHQFASAADYERVNFSASLELAAAASASGVKRFIFLSSVKAAENETAYGYWKWRTEQALAADYASATMAVISVRPALVYGSDVRGNLRSLITGVRRHLPAPPPGGSRSLIGLPDLVDALCLVGESSLGVYSCFEITDGQQYSTRRLYEAIRHGLGRTPGKAWLPDIGWRLACSLVDLLQSVGSEGTYQKLFGDELFSNAKACAALNWQPRHRLETLIGDILAGAD